jgi:hypothetical protein
MTLARIVSELAAEMGLVPLAWLAWLRHKGRNPGLAWWWLAAAFFVSWLADTAALWVDPDLVGNLYPLTQAALVGAVLLDRLEAVEFAYALAVVAFVAVLWRGPLGVDVLLRTVAWGAVAGMAWDRRALGRLRTCLLIAFGLDLVVWYGYALEPGWWSWGAYQGVRALGLVLFCLAAARPIPQLQITRLHRVSDWKRGL